MTTGKLKSIGRHRFGLKTLYFVQCIDCDTIYPEINGTVKCNGHIINKCPWCRSDTKPCENGRGL